MLEDKLLILRIQAGSSDALCRLYHKYDCYLLSLAVNLLGNHSEAQDVVHDVFVAFTRAVDRFKLTGSLKSYLATCVANQARDRIRKKQRHKAVDLDQASQLANKDVSPIQSAILNEQLQQLARAVAQLPYQQREAVILHLHSGLTFRQIARSQNVPANTIKSRYHYGLKKLRSLLNSEV